MEIVKQNCSRTPEPDKGADHVDSRKHAYETLLNEKKEKRKIITELRERRSWKGSIQAEGLAHAKAWEKRVSGAGQGLFCPHLLEGASEAASQIVSSERQGTQWAAMASPKSPAPWSISEQPRWFWALNICGHQNHPLFFLCLTKLGSILMLTANGRSWQC